MKMSYINNIVAIESRARAESKHEEVRNKDREQIQRIIDQTAIRRSTAQVVFETSCQGVINILESDKGTISTIHCEEELPKKPVGRQSADRFSPKHRLSVGRQSADSW